MRYFNLKIWVQDNRNKFIKNNYAYVIFLLDESEIIDTIRPTLTHFISADQLDRLN